MTSRAPSAEGSIASWAQAWPLLFAVPVAMFVGAYYLGPVEYHADDVKWLLAADAGLGGLSQPHPFNHFRPTFYAWVAGLKALSWTSPVALGFAGLLLQLASIGLVYVLAREWLSVRNASIAAAVFAIHPVRQTHWFWTSAHIDALCVAFALVALILASRSMKSAATAPALLGVALATLAAALSKETGFALPLAILLLPIACSLSKRVVVTACAAVGALAALVWSTSVLEGGGRAAGLLTRPDLQVAVRYCLRFVMPFDWLRFSNLYNSPTETRELWFVLALVFSLGTTAVVLLMVWFRRREPWARFGLVLIAWSGAAWIFHQSFGGDRSIGLGAVGFSLLLGGYAQSLSTRSAIAALALLSLFWAPRWLAYAEEWRAADEFGRSLRVAMAELRSEIGEAPEVVVLGVPYTIGEIGEPINVDGADPNASPALVIYGADPEAYAPTVQLTHPTLRLSVEAPAMFEECDAPVLVRDQELSGETIIERTCQATGMLGGLVIDTERLRSELGDTIPVLWTGTELLRLDLQP